jgi:predicted phosphodiesterase
MKKQTKQINDIILGNSHLSYEELSALIMEQLGEDIKPDAVRKRYRNLDLPAKKINSQNSVKAVVEEEKAPFVVDKNNNVSWKYRHGVIELSLNKLDEIFYEYSRKGLNMSQVKIQNKHGFTAIQWQSLKRTFDLVKDSDVFSPYSLSLVSGKEACDMIESKIAEKYSPKNMRAVVEYADEKQRRLAYDNAIKHVSKLDYHRQVFETELLDYISQAKQKVITKRTPDSKVSHGVTTIQDLHIGANIEETKNLPKFDADVVRLRLAQSAKEINARGAAHNTICFNGDIIETFTGLNHINSWKNIDKAYGYGVKATIKSIELITEFLEQVNNVQEVIFVSGNHDRTTSDNKEDVTGEVIQWIHYVLKGKFGHLFKFDWSPDVITREIDGICYVWTHGHLGLSKRPVAEIVNMYGNPRLFTLVIQGHLHTRKILADTAMYRSIVGSSIFTGNDFSANLGFSTLPAILYCHKGLTPYPVVIDIPLL